MTACRALLLLRCRCIGAVLLVLLLVGAACSDDGDSGHNSADVSFVVGMLPHHAQAIVMAGYAERRGARPEVKELAAGIVSRQKTEIERMEGWLEDWGESPRATGQDGHLGMLSAPQLQALEASDGPAFDRLFAEQMIRHHQGAVTAARGELDGGESEKAKELAQAIIDRQNEEITVLEEVLSGG